MNKHRILLHSLVHQLALTGAERHEGNQDQGSALATATEAWQVIVARDAAPLRKMMASLSLEVDLTQDVLAALEKEFIPAMASRLTGDGENR